MTENISDRDMTPDEIELDQDLHTGEGSEGIDNLETFLVAKNTLHTIIDEAMQGNGESTEATTEYLSLMLVETSQSFARTVQTIDNPEEASQYAAELLRSSLIEIEELAVKNECQVSINKSTVEEMTEAFASQAEELSGESEFTMLEETFGTVHQGIISAMMSYAADNKNDVRREKREAIKSKLLDAAKDTAKIALGATAAVLAVRFLGKK